MTLDPLVAEFVPVVPGGELRARYDEQIEELLIESHRARSWSFGTTLDGVLTLDLDAERVLAHAEFMWSRTRWKRGSVELPRPRPSKFALRLPHLSTEALRSSLEVSTFLDGRTLVILLGSGSTHELVPLGDNVAALVRATTLAGFTIRDP